MKRWPAFSLVEIAIVLMIVGVLMTRVPALMNFYKTYETKQQIDLALRSLGACVAQNRPLPAPAPPCDDSGTILRGTLPYKILGIKKKGATINYAIDRYFTGEDARLRADFCRRDLPNYFENESAPARDVVVFELSSGKTKVSVTRNNFVAQYCGTVCRDTGTAA